jgi:hypothetical protein
LDGIVASTSWISGPLPGVDLVRVPGRRFPLVPSIPATNWVDPPVSLQGQVTLSTTFGAALYGLAQRLDVHLVLESGTWFGGGSSWCIAQGLRKNIANPDKPDRWLMTMEIFEPAHTYAVQSLSRMPVTCLRGGTVGIDGYLSAAEAESGSRNHPGGVEHFSLYYERDKALALKTPRLLPQLCSSYDFDVVLLDGNEYTGWAEFEVVRDVCKPRFLALHDCSTLKTEKVEAYLAANVDKWKKVSSGVDAASWAVYERIV